MLLLMFKLVLMVKLGIPQVLLPLQLLLLLQQVPIAFSPQVRASVSATSSKSR